MRMLVVASAIAGVIGNAAFAADMPVKGKVVEVAENWGGWYVGINGGGAWGSVNPSVHDIGPDSFFAGANVPAVVAGGSKDSIRRVDWPARRSATSCRAVERLPD